MSWLSDCKSRRPDFIPSKAAQELLVLARYFGIQARKLCVIGGRIIEIPDRKARKRKCKQRWTEEVQSKKTLDLYAAVKKWLNEEKYVNDPGDRRGARLKFRFRTRSAGLRAEVEGWKNKEEARQCVMCSEGK